MRASQTSLLGLFPTFETIGGVETSGRIAWEPFDADPGKHQLLSYGHATPATNGGSNGCVFRAGTKAEAIITAVRRRWPAQIALVWHLGLLKLLPFLRLRGAKVAVF